MSDLTLIPTKYKPVTKSDTVPVGATMGLYVGGAGDVTVKGDDGVEATFACQSGQYLSGRFCFVMATGTTATGIVALYA